MKYFLLKSDPRYEDMPYIQRLPERLDVRDICQERAHKLPRTSVAFLYPNPHVVFVDFVSSPIPLFSECCMDAIRIYEPGLIYKQVVLLDSENEKLQTYFLPILQKLLCLTENSRFNLDRSVLEYAQLDLSRVGDHSIFHPAEVSGNYTVVRFDVLESMLKRGANGILIEELSTTEGGEESGQRSI